jgi:hypothetical protein
MYNQQLKEEWDEQLRTSNGSVFMTAGVLNILHPGWTLKTLNSTSIVPIFSKRKFGLAYSLQPFLTRTLDGFERLDSTFWDDFFPKICQFNLLHLPKKTPENWEIKELKYQRIPLDISLAKIEDRYAQNIRRFQKKQQYFSLKLNVSTTEFFIFIRKHNPFFKRLKSDLFSRFKELIKYFENKGFGELLSLANENGEIVAMSFYVFDGHSVIDFKGATTREGKKKGAMVLLHLNAIKRYHQKFDFYDFYGANSSGRAHFNKKFGGTNVVYYQFTRINYPSVLKSLIRKIWKI